MNLNTLSKTAVTAISEIPIECRNTLLKLALAINQSPTQDRLKTIEKISSDFNISLTRVVDLLGIFLAIIHLFLHTADKEFNSKLLEIGFSDEFVDGLPLVNNRTKVIDTILHSRKAESNKMISLKWRIDISLTNSVLVNKIPKSVILCLQLKNGKKYTININIRTFHKLRFNIALIMKEITNLKVN